MDQQLSRDVILLDDLRGTLNQVMAWDHTQGGSDPTTAAAVGAGSSSGVNGGNSQEKSTFANSRTAADGSPQALGQENSKALGSLGGAPSKSSGGQQQVSDVRSPGLSTSNEKTGTGKDGLVEDVPVVLGRPAGDNPGGHDSGDDGRQTINGTSQEPGSSPGGRPSTAGLRGNGGGVNSAADDVEWSTDKTVPNDDAGSTTTTSTTTGSNGNCVEWLRKQQKRTTTTPLTDHQRMSLLQHVRPSVFGEPQILSHQRPSVVAAAATRPQSAAATASGHAKRRGGIPCGYRHPAPRASTARTRSRRRDPQGGSECIGPIRRSNGSSTSSGGNIGVSKHGGVLVHDGWIAGEDESSPSVLSTTTGAGAAAVAAAASPRGSRLYRSGDAGTAAGGRGGGNAGPRPVSLVNSVAFGVNMGVLDALSDTTSSVNAAVAFASAAAGQGAISPTMIRSRPSSGRQMNNTTKGNGKEKRRGQSAPRTGRQKQLCN